MRRCAMSIRCIQQPADEAGPLSRLYAWRYQLAHLLVECHEPSRVPLPQKNQRERGSQPIGVRALRQALRVSTPRHGTTRIDKDHGAQIRLFFELLYKQTIRPGEYAPVEIPQFVARLVGAVLGEFD